MAEKSKHRHLLEHEDQPGAIEHHHGLGEVMLSPTAVIIEKAELDELRRLAALAVDHG